MSSVTGHSSYLTGNPSNYTASYSSIYPAPTLYQWVLEPYYSNNVITNGSSQVCTVTYGTPGEYTLYVLGKNAYGSSMAYMNVTIYTDTIHPARSPYPNPVSDILTVPLRQAVTSSTTAAPQGVTPLPAVRPAYDIRLYSEFGSIVKQSVSSEEQAELNVAVLPVGIYYLHVYAVGNTQQDIHKIIIRH
jgi:hypothetical protein